MSALLELDELARPLTRRSISSSCAMVPYSSSKPWIARTGERTPGRYSSRMSQPLELRVEPHVGPAVERLARVAVVAAELLGEIGALEGSVALRIEEMQIGSMKTCGAIATTPRAGDPAPAWISAIDAVGVTDQDRFWIFRAASISGAR